MATQADLNAAIATFQTLADDLAKWLNQLGIDLRAIQDPRTQRTSEMADGVSRSAKNVSTGVITLLNVFQAYTQTLVTGNKVYSGTLLLNFTGAIAYESHNQTVTGQTWVASTSAIWGLYTQGIGPTGGGITADAYNFNMGISNVVAGSGFKLTATCPSAGGVYGAATYPFLWVGFNP